MLSEQQCEKLEQALTEDVEPRKIAAYLCLHMGLTVAEATVLQLSDVDWTQGTVTIRNILYRTPLTPTDKRRYEFVPADVERELPMPPHVKRLFKKYSDFYTDESCFIIDAGQKVPGIHLLQNLLTAINLKYQIAESLSAIMLRNAFIRRCLENGIDILTVGELVGVKQIGELQKRFGAYIKPRLQDIAKLEQFSADYQPPVLPISETGKRMNLLILGAGSQGPVVKEIAEAIGVFDEIAFLDDDPDNALAIDTCKNYRRYIERYPIAIPSFGNSELRAKWVELLEEAGFIMPILVHPSVTISPKAKIKAPAVIEMKAVIATGVQIDRNAIISAATLINPGVTIGANCHIGGGATIMKSTAIHPYSRIPSGMVIGRGEI